LRRFREVTHCTSVKEVEEKGRLILNTKRLYRKLVSMASSQKREVYVEIEVQEPGSTSTPEQDALLLLGEMV